MRFPTIEEVQARLVSIRNFIGQFDADEDEGMEFIEVRLNVQPGGWEVLWGAPDYDLDHKGAWGGGTVSPDDTDDELHSTAFELLAQAQEWAEQMS